MAIIHGRNCKAYYKTEAHAAWPETGAPTGLVEITIIEGDFKPSEEWGTQELDIRGMDHTMVALTKKSFSLDFNIVNDPANAGFAALFSAYDTGGEISLAILNGESTVVGTAGWWGACHVTKWGEDQSNPGRTVSVSVAPSYNAVGPERVTVAAGS